MYLLDLNSPVLDLLDVPTSDGLNLASILAGVLNYGNEPTGFEDIKVYHWGRDLKKSGIIKIDASDLDKLLEFCKTTKLLAPAGKAQLQLAIKNATKAE